MSSNGDLMEEENTRKVPVLKRKQTPSVRGSQAKKGAITRLGRHMEEEEEEDCAVDSRTHANSQFSQTTHV